MPPGQSPDREALERLSAELAHRGPDDAGIVVDGQVGLVHRRLSIVDPGPSGHQPMRHPDGSWLTYNGEVFNHAQLRRSLPPAAYAGDSDSETLLHALAAYGEETPRHCNGLFAFAWADIRRGRLVLVRDRFGVKPLYTARWRGGLWWASEMGALLAAGVPRTPDVELLHHAVGSGWVNGPQTPLQEISRVMPGTLLRVDLRTLRCETREWYSARQAIDPDVARDLASRPRGDLGACVEATLQTAVRRRLMGDVPIGTMCSGGLDSSLITALAALEQPGIQAFTASVTDQPEVDEAPWARRVAEHLGVDLHCVSMTADSWRGDLVGAVQHTEYPLTHESSVPMGQIAALAHGRGVKVLLSGEGADELFGGYDWTDQRPRADFAARDRRLEVVARRAYRWLSRHGIGGFGGAPRQPARVAAFERAVRAGAERAFGHQPWPRRRLAGAGLADLALYLPHLLNRQDKNTMHHSVETRVPFLDPDLVACAVNLPLEVKVEPRRKEILREIAGRHLPPGVIDRPKVGFGFDTGRYIHSAARPGFLRDGRLRELFGADRAVWDANLADGGSLLGWTGEIWARLMVDGQSPASVTSDLWR